MYCQTQSRVKIPSTNSFTEYFPFELGTCQGCNLSPTLFNIYINDLPYCLSKIQNNPIMIGETQVSCLMYADDIVLHSTSEKGLQASLNCLEEFCNKWRMEINLNKTKSLTFNSRKISPALTLNGQPVENVNSYCYLGFTLTKSGSFHAAKEGLARKGAKAFFGINQCTKNISARTTLKLFDSIIKPIILYCSEIWGLSELSNTHCNPLFKMLTRQDTPYEKLQTRVCKQTLGLNRNSCNIPSKTELGRIPLGNSIISNIIKFWIHVMHSNENSLLYKTYIFQNTNVSSNSYSLWSKIQIIAKHCKLNKEEIPPENWTQEQTSKFICKTKSATQNIYAQFANDYLKNTDQNTGKLNIYRQIKNNIIFESYLDKVKNCDHRKALTRLRLSAHNLPIERGRHLGIPREQRFCTLCKTTAIGDEVHLLANCNHPSVTITRHKFREKIQAISPQTSLLNNKQLALYILSAADASTQAISAKYCHDILNIVSQQSKSM